MADSRGNPVISGTLTRNNFASIFPGFSERPSDVVGGHLGEGEEGLATDGGGSDGCERGISMFAEHVGVNTLRIKTNGFTEVKTEASGIKESPAAKNPAWS